MSPNKLVKQGSAAILRIGFPRTDFRFGTINLLFLILIIVAGGIVQATSEVPPGAEVPLQPLRLGVLTALVMGGILFVQPYWHVVIGLGVIHWIILQSIYSGFSLLPIYIGTYAGLLIAAAVQVANQWEKGVILRLGKFRAVKGPGFFIILPLLDRVDCFIDHRVRATDFRAETTLTRDTVPVNVDAIAFWLVWDAKMSVLEVANFEEAVILSAQTALRDALGRHELGDILTHRERVGQEIQKVLERKIDPWGITIQSIEIRDIIIPKALEDAMSRQAQAERERQSRVILGTAETEIAEKFAKASEAYRDNPVALHLRAMNMVFEGLKQKGSMIIVPSTAVETMGLGALGGLTAFDRTLPSRADGKGIEDSAAPDQDSKAQAAERDPGARD